MIGNILCFSANDTIITSCKFTLHHLWDGTLKSVIRTKDFDLFLQSIRTNAEIIF